MLFSPASTDRPGCIFYRGVRPPEMGILYMKLFCIWWRRCCSIVLGCAEYSFILITPRSILNQSTRAKSMDQIDLFLKLFWFIILNYKYENHYISFPTFFVWALLLIVYTWNSRPLRSNLLPLQCTCCTVPITSGMPHGSRLAWVCQWPSSQPLSSSQLSHNDSLWA